MVGGCVRDRLMGRAVKDWDVEVYNVEPAVLRRLLDRLGRVNVVGEAFTVYKLGQDLDVSLPRRERKTGRGHRAYFIEGDPSMPVEEATRRRDFTVNAILEDPLTNELIDPFGGRADLERETLRAVSAETFAEDSLRVLRAAQFAARFEFEVEPETVELCRGIDLSDLPAERVWGEMEKLLLQAQRPSLGFEWLRRLGAIRQLFPEVEALIGCPQDPEWHPEGWSLSELPSHLALQPLIASVAETASINRRLTLRELCARASASSAVIPASDSTVNARPAKAAPVNLVAADSAGANDLDAPPVSRPTILTQPQSFVWSSGSSAPPTSEIIRVMFKVPFNRVCSIVRGAVNDFEILRGVVHPVAVFVMNVLAPPESTAELQLHDEAVNTDGAVTPRPTGIHIPVIVAQVGSAAVDDDVLFNFDLALVRNGEGFHGPESGTKPRCFQVNVGDVWIHNNQVIDIARELVDDLDHPRRVTVMLAALCHDFGKPSTTEFVEGRIRSRGHEEAGVRPTESFLERLRVHTLEGYDVRAQVIALVRDHLKPGEFYRLRAEIGDGAFRRLARRCELDLLYRVARADSLGRNAPWVPRGRWYTAEAQEWFVARARELEVEQKAPAPLLMGRHLIEMGLKPSPLFGQILDAVYEMQLDGRVGDLEAAKSEARALVEKMRAE
jgi:hypothetical protein